MILQALKEYYDRLSADPESGIAPDGWEIKEIPFVVVIDKNGNFIQIEDTREGESKKRIGRKFLVPQGVKKTSGIAANLLWDVAGYVFGIAKTEGLSPEKSQKAIDRAKEQKTAFYDKITEVLPNSHLASIAAKSISNLPIPRLEQEPAWPEICATNPVISIRFSDEIKLLCNMPEIARILTQVKTPNNGTGFCLVTGLEEPIVSLHTSIKGVYGAQSSGANIVSFNLPAFRSFKKEQGKNAPISERSMFAYTTALNNLLEKNSRQRMQIGDASTVFWSAKKTQFESDFGFFFKEPEKDDPASNTQRIKGLYNSIRNGAYFDDTGDEKFYVLGLSPNAARISVRFWQVGTVAEFASKIWRHFSDLEIIKPPKEPEYYSIWRLLVNLATLDKSENIPPNLAGDFMRTILSELPYPVTLLQAALRRIHCDTENRVKPVRAALIKAWLNRYGRIHPSPNTKEIEMALDTDQPSIGYQMGRLFAVLEKVQEEANPGLNATIRERYYGSACCSPVTVFPTLMRLKNHHIAKLENKGRAVNMERLMGEIVGRFNDFPPHLSLHEQGRFAIGYYHQRQDFFTKKD